MKAAKAKTAYLDEPDLTSGDKGSPAAAHRLFCEPAVFQKTGRGSSGIYPTGGKTADGLWYWFCGSDQGAQ